MTVASKLPDRPPFLLRARLLTPLAGGGTRYEPDGAIEVDAAGRIVAVGPWSDRPAGVEPAEVDLRPLVVLPGLVDLHVHLPQLPERRRRGRPGPADLARSLHLPAGARFDAAAAERLAPGRVPGDGRRRHDDRVDRTAPSSRPSLDAAFRAAEAHGIRAIIGKVMMDRADLRRPAAGRPILELSLRQSADLCARWHGARRRPAAVRVHAALRRVLQRRDAAGVGGPRPPDRRVLADPPVRGPRRDRARSPGCSRRRSTTSTSTTGRAGSARGRCSPTPSTCPTRAGPARRDRRRPSPTARPRTCSWHRGRCPWRATSRPGLVGRPGLGRRGGPELSHLADMRAGGVHPERAARPRC